MNFTKQLLKDSLTKIQNNLKTFQPETKIINQKFKLVLDSKQQQWFKELTGACRNVFNFVVSFQQEYFEANKKLATIKELNEAYVKYKEANKFLYEYDSIALQQTMLIANQICKQFVKKLKYKQWIQEQIANNAKKENLSVEEYKKLHCKKTNKAIKNNKKELTWKTLFRTKKDPRQSFTTMINNYSVSFAKNDDLTKINKKALLFFPKLKEAIRCIRHQGLDKLSSKVVVKKTPHNDYFVVFAIETKIKTINVKNIKKICGIDLGCINYFKTSSESQAGIKKIKQHVNNNWNKLKRIIKHIDKIQSRISLLKNFHHIEVVDKDKLPDIKSTNFKNLNKLIDQFHKLWKKAMNLKNNTLWVLAKFFANNFDIIALETLNSNKLKESNKWFAKIIQKFPFFRIKQNIIWQCEKLGKISYLADSHFASSKICSNCGHQLKKEELPLSVRQWTCPVCGKIHDRDENAAFNLRNDALEYLLKCIELDCSVMSNVVCDNKVGILDAKKEYDKQQNRKEQFKLQNKRDKTNK